MNIKTLKIPEVKYEWQQNSNITIYRYMMKIKWWTVILNAENVCVTDEDRHVYVQYVCLYEISEADTYREHLISY